MKCHVCGSILLPVETDMPFKVSDRTIVIIKRLPVLQCEGCREFVIEDAVMERVEALLSDVGGMTELEVIRFAA